jgi:hypothetical protein
LKIKTYKISECPEQPIAIIENKKDKIIKLKDVITSFGSKYNVKLSFKDILWIRIPIKIKLTPHITYKILALVDAVCTKNIIYDKYFIKCPELVHTIDDKIPETSITNRCRHQNAAIEAPPPRRRPTVVVRIPSPHLARPPPCSAPVEEVKTSSSGKPSARRAGRTPAPGYSFRIKKYIENKNHKIQNKFPYNPVE